MLGRERAVMGVISLPAEATHEFGRADLDFLDHSATLIAGALENARLYEQATVRVELLTTLSRLSQSIASAGSEVDVLRAVVDGTRDLLRADRCEIHLLHADGRLHLAMARPERLGSRPVELRTLWPAPFDPHDTAAGADRRVATSLWGEDPSRVPIVAPLVAGEDRLGILAGQLPRTASDAR